MKNFKETNPTKIKNSGKNSTNNSLLNSKLSPLTSHLSPLTSHLSPLTSHLSPLTSHLSGITLIALVVTIVILLILAGITVTTLFGENGLLNRAQDAVEKTNYAKAEEKVKLAVLASYDKTAKLDKDLLKQNLNNIEGINPKVEEITWDLTVTVDGYIFKITELGNVTYLGKTNLPENTPQNPQSMGEEVALKEGWGTQTVKYIKTADGTENTQITTVATVYAISVGNGETVPVPKGFYYVGGTLATGVIISDNSDDRYGYNPETKKENDTSLNKTTWEYAPNLKGNQFVWIPCAINEYKKTTTFTIASGAAAKNANYDTSTNSAEKTQIEKYGGFYVGRYEAGTSSIKGIDFANITTTGWTTDSANYSKVTSGNVTSKANEIPYYHADYITAVEMSERMYKNDTERNNYVNSGLVTGTMWDVMINKMNEKTSCNLSSSGDWGNYLDKAWEISRGSYCAVNSSGGHGSWATIASDSTYSKTTNSRAILSTASNTNFGKYNLYDVAGNLWEWTQEMAFNSNTAEWFMLRGGGFLVACGSYPASFRSNHPTTGTYASFGFRVVLYIK